VREELLEIFLRKLVIETLDQRDTFLARDFAVANLLGGIIGSPADAELDERRVVMEGIDAVVDRAVLGIRALGSLGIRGEAGMFGRVVVALLGVPLEIVAEVVYGRAGSVRFFRFHGLVGIEIFRRQFMLRN